MKSILPLFLLALLFTCCSQTKNQEPAANELTEQQKEEGWKVLFDGQTMNGWRSFKNNEGDNWEVVDGTLHSKPVKDTVAKRVDILTVEQYGNFELLFDWKISQQGNSGVMYRVSEEFDQPYASGPEYQLLDDEGYPGDLKDVQLTGTNYDMQATGPKKLNPEGQWNQSKIVVNGNHVEHWLNGDKIVEYELYSEAWKQQVANSKWKEFPGYGLTPKGYIDLQDHGHEVWFRSLFIREL